MSTEFDERAPIFSGRSPTFLRKPQGKLGIVPIVPVETISPFKPGQTFLMEGLRTGKAWSKYLIALTGDASQKVGSPIIQIEVTDGETTNFVNLDTVKRLPEAAFEVGTTVWTRGGRAGYIHRILQDGRFVVVIDQPSVPLYWEYYDRTGLLKLNLGKTPPILRFAKSAAAPARVVEEYCDIPDTDWGWSTPFMPYTL